MASSPHTLIVMMTTWADEWPQASPMTSDDVSNSRASNASKRDDMLASRRGKNANVVLVVEQVAEAEFVLDDEGAVDLEHATMHNVS